MSEHTYIRRALATIFVVIIAVGVVVYLGATRVAEDAASQQALVGYNNAIRACQRGNPKSRAYTRAVAAAAANPATDAKVRAEFQESLDEIRHERYIRYDGTTECKKAYVKP